MAAAIDNETEWTWPLHIPGLLCSEWCFVKYLLRLFLFHAFHRRMEHIRIQTHRRRQVNAAETIGMCHKVRISAI